MKKTISINISGIIFNLDEDAYDVLKEYLHKLNLHFSASEEGREVIQDIEARIAELFQAKLSDSKQVITIDDVNEIIEIMGSPDDFADEINEDEPEAKQESSRTKRKFYRDSDNKVLGGVCSGFAALFDIDILLVRVIAFILLVFSAPIMIILYIVLWIVIPEAVTTAQKLEMRGEKVTVSNIEKTIKDEFENVKENFNNFKKSKSAHQAKEVGSQIANVLFDILRIAVRVFVIILGILLVIIGIFSLLGFFGAFFFQSSFFPLFSFGHIHFNLPGLFHLFASPASINLFTIGLFSVIVIPLVVIAYAGIKMLINFKANDKLLLLTLLFAWIFGLFLMIGSVLFEGKNFTTKEVVKEKFELESTYPKLYLQLNELSFDESETVIMEDDYIIVNQHEEVQQLFIKPQVDIQKSYTDNFEIVFTKSARGKDRNSAEANAKSINYSWVQNDSSIILNSLFSINSEAKWRAPQLRIIIKVPEGKEIYIADELEDLLYNIENVDHLWDSEMGNKSYKMLPQGLKKTE